MTRQAESRMIQPCSKDGGRQRETEMQEGGERRGRGGGGYIEHMAKRRLKGRGTERRGGEGSGRDDHDRDNKWGVYIYSREEFTRGVKGGTY